MDWLAYIKEAGPFTAPLCVGMVVVIRWLLTDRKRLLDLLEEAEAERRSLRDKRAGELERAAIEYREHGEAMREVMREWSGKAQSVLDLVQGASR